MTPRPRGRGTGRVAKTSSVSLLPHIADVLEEHNISATDAVKRYVDYLLDEGESKIIEREIQLRKWEIEDLEEKLKRAKVREERVARRGGP